MESNFASGLGTSTNKQYEAYALYQGLLLVKEFNINSLTSIGDSSVIIKLMALDLALKENKLTSIIVIINKEVKNLTKVSLYQVLRVLLYNISFPRAQGK